MRRIVALSITVAVLPVSLAAQDEDRGFLVELIQDSLSGAGRQVEIDGFEGLLSSNATLERLSIADSEGVWLVLNDASLVWSRTALLRGRLEVDELRAASLTITRAPISEGEAVPAAEATPFSLPDLPVSVELDRLSVERIELGETLLGQAAALSLDASATLVDGSGSISLNAQRLDDRQGQFLINAGYQAEGEVLSLDLDVREGASGLIAELAKLPGAPDLSATIKGEGPLSNFLADLALSTRGTERLSGTVSLGQTGDARIFDADISGDVSSLFLPSYQAFFGTDMQLAASGTQSSEGALRLNNFNIAAQAIDLEGQISLDNAGWPSLIDVTGKIGKQDGTPVVLPISGTRTEVERVALDIQFDAAEGDEWAGVFNVLGLAQDQLAIGQAQLRGGGVLQGDSGEGGRATADLELASDDVRFDDPALQSAVGDVLEGALSVVYASDAPIELNDLALRAGNLGVTGNAQIKGLDDALETTLDLSLDAEDLSRFAQLSGQDLTGSAQFNIAGDLALGGAFDLALDGAAEGLSIGIAQADAILAGRSTLDLSVVRDTTGTELRGLDLRNNQVALEASGSIATGDADLRLNANLADASLLTPELTGPITLDGTARQQNERWTVRADAAGPWEAQAAVEAEIQGDEVTVDLTASVPDASQITAELEGPLELLANAEKQPEGWQINADASGPFDVTAEVSGLVGDTMRVNYAAELPEISELVPQLSGPVTLAGQATQTGEVLNVTANATGPYEAIVGVDADIGETIIAAYNATLPDLSQVVPQLSGDLTVSGEATQTDAGWDVTANATGPYEATVNVAAAISDTISADYSANIPQLSRVPELAGINPPLNGPLTVKGRAAQEGSAWDVTLDGDGPFASTLSAQARVDGSAISAEFTSRLPDASRLSPQVSGPLNLDGQARNDGDDWIVSLGAGGPFGATATVDGTYSVGTSVFDYTARLPNTAALVPGINGPLNVTGDAREGADGWQITTNGTGPSGTDFNVGGRVLGDPMLDLELSGTVPLGLANPFLSPRSIAGEARFDLGLRGAAELSSLSGNVTSNGARLNLPTVSAALTDINTNVSLSSGRANIDISADMSSGGTVSVSGPVTLSGAYPANLVIALNRFGLFDPTLYKTSLDGQVTINGNLTSNARIAGALQLGQTDISVPSTGLSSLGDIPDITHIRSPRPVQRSRERAGLVKTETETASSSTGPAFPLDLSVSAPSRIFVRGRGLDAELTGGVQVTGTSANPITAGQFELVRGRLDILGKRFTLDEGQVDLQGSTDPYLRFVATTTITGGTASIVISGPASAPVVTFESDPQLPQDEVLAQIFFGRDISQLSAFQALQLASAVATLAGRGGEGVVAKLRKGFDLDDLDVGTDDEGNASLRAGKYISENVYTDVTIGSDGDSSISLNLDITPSVTARGEVGTAGDTSIGIYFERDY